MSRTVRIEYHLETSKPYLYRETAKGKEYRVASRRVLVAIPSHPTTPWAWVRHYHFINAAYRLMRFL